MILHYILDNTLYYSPMNGLINGAVQDVRQVVSIGCLQLIEPPNPVGLVPLTTTTDCTRVRYMAAGQRSGLQGSHNQ
jgi:hypothetical protein